MAEREPAAATNLDRYGSPALAWSRVRDLLVEGPERGTFFLGTAGPDGKRHAAGVGALYREQGWPAEVEGDAFTAPYSAPSAGPPPWYLYRFAFHTAFGWPARS